MTTTSANASFLSSPKFGYDFVVATSQASINAGLKEYLSNSNAPVKTICFLADDDGNPTEVISLEDLMAKTGGINPFDIPLDTPYNDPRIAILTKQKFKVGLKLKMGFPAGVDLETLPPIVTLGSSANNVGFNMFCSQLEIIENSPASGFGSSGAWNVWSQPEGTSWHFNTSVNLVYADLDRELDTPYFKAHPSQKQALLNQLKNKGSGAFSLQQLLFDLDNAALQSVPNIEGVPRGSDAEAVLTKTFVNLYSQSAKDYGQPVLAIKKVDNSPTPTTLTLTGMEREVSRVVDSEGVVIERPSPEQMEATTLDYLCAANHHHLPGAAGFDWNWVAPSDLGKVSGVLAINRNTISQFYKNQLMPLVKGACLKPWVSTKVGVGTARYSSTLTPDQTPQSVSFPTEGPEVLKIEYAGKDHSFHRHLSATSAKFDMDSNYSCTVSFIDNKIIIVQNLTIWIRLAFDLTQKEGNVVNRTITDTYTLEVSGDGGLLFSKGEPVVDDQSQKVKLSGFVNFFVGLNDVLNDIKNKSGAIASHDLSSFPATNLREFIFPGAKVFAFKDARFSEHQDLVADITYQD